MFQKNQMSVMVAKEATHGFKKQNYFINVSGQSFLKAYWKGKPGERQLVVEELENGSETWKQCRKEWGYNGENRALISEEMHEEVFLAVNKLLSQKKRILTSKKQLKNCLFNTAKNVVEKVKEVDAVLSKKHYNNSRPVTIGEVMANQFGILAQ